MKRRSYLTAMLAAIAGIEGGFARRRPAEESRSFCIAIFPSTPPGSRRC